MEVMIMKNIKRILCIIIVIAMVSAVLPSTVEAKTTPKLNKTKLTLTITQKKTKPAYKLKVKNKTGKIKWKTSNKKVATVSSTGKVTAKKKGNAVITAKVGKRTLRCKVTVKDTRKAKIPTPVKTPTPGAISTPAPTPTSTPKCEHVYEDHWATFEEYYEDNPNTTWKCACTCGMFVDEAQYKQHLSQISVYKSVCVDKDGWCIGLHAPNAKTSVITFPVDDKSYTVIKTEYIDKRICTKCGNVLEEAWDTPEYMKDMCSNGRMIPIDPNLVPVPTASPGVE